MKVTIDRFEGDFAVVEMPDLTMVNMPIKLLPNAKEGDVINISIDKTETDKRKIEVDKLIKDLWID